MSVPIRVGILGVGMIARGQHIPSIAANPAFLLVATASHHAGIGGIDNHASLEDMLASGAPLDAIAICTPPQMHYDAARRCLLAGKHVLLEKPPCTSISQFSHLKLLAEQAGVTLYQAWHSQHAHGVTRAVAGLKKMRGGAVSGQPGGKMSGVGIRVKLGSGRRADLASWMRGSTPYPS